ncbi:hypothetical protein [Roseomonas chloroacetimidivorans]|uniref:hypothetical protein n=1 Tax=Roseomonas chloroacetimidivorans TaxID=1766656 RepID=UPI003C708D5F
MTLHPRASSQRPSLNERAELLDLWDSLSPDEREMVMFFVRSLAKGSGTLAPELAAWWKKQSPEQHARVLALVRAMTEEER